MRHEIGHPEHLQAHSNVLKMSPKAAHRRNRIKIVFIEGENVGDTKHEV